MGGGGYGPMAWAAWDERCPQTIPLWKVRPREQEQGWDLMGMESESPAWGQDDYPWCFRMNS